jgi:hypothetical protein
VFTQVSPLRDAAWLIDGMVNALLANREPDAEAIAGVQDRFRRDPELAALLRGGLEAVGVDPVHTYWDSPYLRVVPPADPGAERQIGRIGLHRDTWSSNIPQQSNWWTTVYPLAADRTIAFLPGYWSRPLANTSADWDLDEIRSRRRAGERDEELPIVPEPTGPVDLSSELRIVIEPGDLLCFSGAHLHGSVPNTSERARVSVELRTVNRDDLDAGRGAPAIDGRAPRVPHHWFRSMADGAPLSREPPG